MARNIKNDASETVSTNGQAPKVAETETQAPTSATEGASDPEEDLQALLALVDKASVKKGKRRGRADVAYKVDGARLREIETRDDFPGLPNQAKQLVKYLIVNGPLTIDQLDTLDSKGERIPGRFANGESLYREKGNLSVQTPSEIARAYLTSRLGKSTEGKSMGLTDWGILVPVHKSASK